MKKLTWVLGIIIIVLIIVGFGFLYANRSKTPQQPTKETITELLSKKYNKATNDISIEVQSETGKHARGVYADMQPGGDRGVWFATKTKQGWELVFDGNGIITCDIANQYNFPTEVIPQCLEKGPDGSNLIKR